MTNSQDESFMPDVRDCGTFLLDVVGVFRQEEIVVQWSPAARVADPQVEVFIEQTWQAELKRAGKTGARLYDGPMCRLASCSADHGRLELSLEPTSYRAFIGTNATHSNIRYAHGRDSLADPLGVSAAVASADGFLVLGRRSSQVAAYPGRLHPVGGMVEFQAGRAPDPFAAAAEEIHEELGLATADQMPAVCLGIVRDKHTFQPEMILDVPVRADFSAIRVSAAAAEDAGEHSELLAVRDHPAAVVMFIERNYRELTPIALATLLLHGQRHWGCGWFTTTRGYLRSVI